MYTRQHIHRVADRHSCCSEKFPENFRKVAWKAKELDRWAPLLCADWLILGVLVDKKLTVQ